ncbi:MAG: hypothetical protein A2270_08385 [Elusimicrobia bacterium RIFOXYA12_FULL_51_18]|nr:MAG: hypothetical protein A2270_08385 [Elusimicrobia bacterium RIFOXYA12_FULL_51_18]OGS28768.1 MAG: hypothetical protein A2218_11415 [Elusimicrobia bacterium RIFOXYA2_FULL_53_38]
MKSDSSLNIRAKNRLAVGIDRGGTRTRIVLINGRGAVLKRVVHPTSHIKYLPDLIIKTAAAWRLEAHVPVIIATRGAMTKKWKKPFLLKKLKDRINLLDVISDAQAAYIAAHGSGDGILLIAGTGSVIFLKYRNGRFKKIGGNNPAGGDLGSGLWIGTRFLKRIKADKRRLTRRARAAYAAEAMRKAEAGDKTAVGLIREAHEHLSDLLAAAVNICLDTVSKPRAAKARLAPEPLSVALAGGLMQNAFFRKNFISRAQERLVAVRLVFIALKRPAENAAAELALGSFYAGNKNT